MTCWRILGNLGSSLHGLTVGRHVSKWTSINNVDEPRYISVDDDAGAGAVSDLPVSELHHSRPTVSFSDEYRRLATGCTFPCTVAQLPHNADLNRPVLGQLSLASLRGRLIEYQLRLG